MKTYWKYWFVGFLALVLAAGVGCSSAKSPTSQNAAGDAKMSETKPDQQAASAASAQDNRQASNVQSSGGTSETMPKTASPLVWMGLVGAGTLGTGVTLRIVRKWKS